MIRPVSSTERVVCIRQASQFGFRVYRRPPRPQRFLDRLDGPRDTRAVSARRGDDDPPFTLKRCAIAAGLPPDSA